MMRVDSLSAQADRSGRYMVKFSDGTVMRLYRQTVEDFALYTGMELDCSQLDALRDAAGQMSAKMRAVRIVAASSVSKEDLEQRLIQKGENKKQAREAVLWMEEMALVDDRETARQIVRRGAAKGYGCARVKQMLYEKRIPKELWDEALDEFPDQTDKMVDFLKTRLTEAWDQKELKRAIDALLRRGHAYSEIRKALQQLQMDMEDFPEEQ